MALPEKAVGALAAEAEAKYWQGEFIAWLERKRRKDNETLMSILQSWSKGGKTDA